MPVRLPHGEVATRGHAISVLFGFCVSFICDTYIALTWNCSPGARASSDEPPTRIQQNRRQGHAKEDSSQVPEAGDILTLQPLEELF
jgi:hypothetical protein